jgi:ribosomal protein S18 acetylase RimI-like enzyme
VALRISGTTITPPKPDKTFIFDFYIMSTTKITVFDPSIHGHLLPALVDLHVDCIEDDNSLMRFHPPFDEEKRGKMLRFWEARTGLIAEGLKIRFMTMDVSTDGVESLSGVVELGMPESDTGPFRGDVEMLMISPAHRRKGLARLLMDEMEKAALQRGRTLLVRSPLRGS